MWLFVKNVIFTLLVPATVAFFLPLTLFSQPIAWPAQWDLRSIAGIVIVGFGVAIYFWSLWAFSVIGRATPAPIDAPKFVVLDGPFRYVRNPFYIGVVTAILGEALFFADSRFAIHAAIVALVFHLFVVLVEEPSLSQQFGASYARYKATVGRWLPGRPYAP